MVPSSDLPVDSSAKANGNADGSDALAKAESRFDRAIASLAHALASRQEQEEELLDVEAEVQRMGADRARLAESLDSAEARAKRLEETNREVSNRLVNAMESIRSVLDGET